MGMIQVTASELRNRAEGLQNLNAQFKSKASDLEAKEVALCSMWEGQTKTAFHNAFARDRQQMDAFHGLLGQYVQALYEIASAYEQAEARNTEIAAARSY